MNSFIKLISSMLGKPDTSKAGNQNLQQIEDPINPEVISFKEKVKEKKASAANLKEKFNSFWRAKDYFSAQSLIKMGYVPFMEIDDEGKSIYCDKELANYLFNLTDSSQAFIYTSFSDITRTYPGFISVLDDHKEAVRRHLLQSIDNMSHMEIVCKKDKQHLGGHVIINVVGNNPRNCIYCHDKEQVKEDWKKLFSEISMQFRPTNLIFFLELAYHMKTLKFENLQEIQKNIERLLVINKEAIKISETMETNSLSSLEEFNKAFIYPIKKKTEFYLNILASSEKFKNDAENLIDVLNKPLENPVQKLNKKIERYYIEQLPALSNVEEDIQKRVTKIEAIGAKIFDEHKSIISVEIRQSIKSMLDTTLVKALEAYLKLTPEYRKTLKDEQQRSPKQILEGTLESIEAQMIQIDMDLAKVYLKALSVEERVQINREKANQISIQGDIVPLKLKHNSG